MYREILTEDHQNAALLLQAIRTVQGDWAHCSLNTLRMVRDILAADDGTSARYQRIVRSAIGERIWFEIFQRERAALLALIEPLWKNKAADQQLGICYRATGSTYHSVEDFVNEAEVDHLKRVLKHLWGTPYPGDLGVDMMRQVQLIVKESDELTDEDKVELRELATRLEWLQVADISV